MGNICYSSGSVVSPNETMTQFDRNRRETNRGGHMSYDMKSVTSTTHDQRDQVSLAGGFEETQYQIVKACFFNFNGSWLGNVVGTTKLKKFAFSRNTQLYLTIHKKTKVSFLVHQEEFGRNKQAACLYLLRFKSDKHKLRTFRDSDVHFKSKVSMRPIKAELELDPLNYSYVIIVSHTTTREGGYTLAIEGDQEMTLKVPKTFTSWFQQPKRHKIKISGEWKGESASGSPETNPTEWLKHCNQIPIMIKRPTRCLIRLTRTTPQNLSIGMFAVKSNGQASSEQYYAHQTLLDDDIVGQAGYTFLDTLEFRAFLQPKINPYIFIPVAEHKGMEGTFDLEIFSDEEIQEVKQNRIKKTSEEQGIWFERSCGGRPGTDRFFRCPQFFVTIKANDDKAVPVTITVEQHVEMNQYIPAGFYVLKAGYRVTQKNFQENMIVARKPSGFMKKITTEVYLNNGQSYTIIPCPRSYNFSRDIPFTITLSTFLPSDTSISFDPSPENSEEFDNMEEFKCTRVPGAWEKLTSGGDPLSGYGFFNNPQYTLNTDMRTRMEISIIRLSQKWIPMAFFIIKTSEGNKRISHLDNLIKDKNGLYSHNDESSEGDKLIGQVRFTSGVEEEVSGNFTLASGTYTIIAASQVSGREGNFVLQVKSDQDIELLPLHQIEVHNTEVVGSFIGGLSSLYPHHQQFKNNPRYTCISSVDQLVLLSLSQPPAQMLNLCLHTKSDSDEYLSSQIFSWKEITLELMVRAGVKYEIVVATAEGKEGEYALSASSNISPIQLEPTPTVISRGLSSCALEECSHKLVGELYGLCHASQNNSFNPQFKLSHKDAEVVNVIECCIHSSIQSLGIKLHSGSEVIYDSGDIQNSSTNTFLRRFLLPSLGDYILEVYPSEITSKRSFSATIKSSSPVVIKDLPCKNQERISLEAAWNIGRTSASDTNHPNFVYNPQWMIKVDKKSQFIFEISNEDGAKTVDMLGYNSLNLLDETEDYINPSKSEECSIALFLVHGNSSSSDTQLESVSQDDIIGWSGWKSLSNATLHTILEPSEQPYYIIVSSIGFLRRNSVYSFQLNIYSDVDNLATKVLPVPRRVFKAFEPDSTFVRQSMMVNWSHHLTGHPDEVNHQQEWIKNNKVKVFIPQDARCKFSIPHSGNQAIGIAIVKGSPQNDGVIVPNLYENDVYADSLYDPNDEIGGPTYVYLPASTEPYFVVPFCYTYQSDSTYSLMLETDVADVRLELDNDSQSLLHSSVFSSGWRAGIAGGEYEENAAKHTFSNNPRFYMEVSENLKENIFLSLESAVKNKIKMFIFKQNNDDEDQATPKLQEVLFQSSKWSLDGTSSCEISPSPGTYVIVPSIYPAGLSGKFNLNIQGDDSVRVYEDDNNLKYPLIEEAALTGIKFSLLQSPCSSYQSLFDSLEEKEMMPFNVTGENSSFRISVSHLGHSVSVGFIVLRIDEGAAFNPDAVAAKSDFTSFYLEATTVFCLEKGSYCFIPLVLSCGLKTDLQEQIFVHFEYTASSTEIDTLSSNFIVVDQIPKPPTLQLADLSANPEASILLEGVSQISLRDDENGRFASPLTIFGPTVFPVLTGISTSLYMYETQFKNRRRILERLDKLGMTNRTLVDLNLPYAGAGAFGKGRVVAIGDIFVFSRHQLTTCDNYTFLMNCISWLLPDSSNSMQVDILASPRGMFRASPSTTPKRKLSIGSQSPNMKISPASPVPAAKILSSSVVEDIVDAAKNANRSKIAKPTIVCYSRQKDLLPIESLSYDYVVKTANSLEKVPEMNAEVILLILDHLDKVEKNHLKGINDYVKTTGSGLLVLASCQVDDDFKKSISHSANLLLGEMGIVIGDGDIIENANHNHDALWWLTQEEKKGYAKPPRFELHTPTLSVFHSNHRLMHVGHCLRLFQEMERNGDKNQYPDEYQQLCHMLFHACYTIPSNDRFILPKLLEIFGDPRLKISSEDPLLKSNMKSRFAMALNTNLWLSMDYKDMPSLRERDFALDAETQEVTLSKDYQGSFSTGIYARSGEEITVTVPNILVDAGCTVQIGFRTQNLIWLRDSDLQRYSLQWICEPITHNRTIIANPFGGQVYISIPAPVFKSIKKQPIRLHITGGCATPQYKFQQTTPFQWLQSIYESTAPYSEWISDRVILTIPTKDAQLIVDPSVSLRFWRDAIMSMEKISHSRFPHTQRIIVDSQVVAGLTTSGFPCIVHENLLWKGIIAEKEEHLFDNCNLIRELAHNMHQKHSYVWNQRNFAIANVYKAYALQQAMGINVNETEYYSKNITLVRDFLHRGDDLSRAKRLQMYQNNTTLSTMFEFILIEEFGWEPYEKLFTFFHEEFDVKNKRILTNQEKVDRWVVRFSEIIEFDVSDYFEKFGLKVNASTKSKISVYPKWMVLL